MVMFDASLTHCLKTFPTPMQGSRAPKHAAIQMHETVTFLITFPTSETGRKLSWIIVSFKYKNGCDNYI